MDRLEEEQDRQAEDRPYDCPRGHPALGQQEGDRVGIQLVLDAEGPERLTGPVHCLPPRVEDLVRQVELTDALVQDIIPGWIGRRSRYTAGGVWNPLGRS